jgi:hypothetical protein
MPTYVEDEELLPSTYKETRTVEEVVREIRDDRDKLHRRGILNLPYEELSLAEKVNYEIYFARNVCELLATKVPGSIGLHVMEGRSYRTIYCVGSADSEKPIETAFEGLREAGVHLMDRPLTKISNKTSGYQFVLTGEPRFGLDLSAPHLIGLGDLPARDELDAVVRRITRIADRAGVRLKKEPSRTDVKVIGRFRRFHYALSGLSSYQGFVKFVEGLVAAEVGCAFQHFRVAARSHGNVSIDAELVITTHD